VVGIDRSGPFQAPVAAIWWLWSTNRGHMAINPIQTRDGKTHSDREAPFCGKGFLAVTLRS
jgi:hypothetical protein